MKTLCENLNEAAVIDPAEATTRPPSAPAVPQPAGGSAENPPPSPFNAPPDEILNSELTQPPFQRLVGETPRAYNAFMTFFQLGQCRSHQAVADKLGEGMPTVRNWAWKYDWSDRLCAYSSGLLQQKARAEAALQRQHAVDWAKRLENFRQQEWDAAQKLLGAAQCFLETFGDEALQKMTLAQVSRALNISSRIGRLALVGAELPVSTEPEISPLQQQMLDAIKRVYGQDPSAASAPSNHVSPNHQSTTTN